MLSIKFNYLRGVGRTMFATCNRLLARSVGRLTALPRYMKGLSFLACPNSIGIQTDNLLQIRCTVPTFSTGCFSPALRLNVTSWRTVALYISENAPPQGALGGQSDAKDQVDARGVRCGWAGRSDSVGVFAEKPLNKATPSDCLIPLGRS